MNTELHKRLEEAADNFIGHPYEIEEGIDITDKRTAFKAGAELGYKEAIKAAKEWLMGYFVVDNSLMSASGCDLFLRAFETDMNKLLEEQK